MIKKFLILGSLILISIPKIEYGHQNIKPAQPTHYFYTPTPYVNKPFSLVASLHEISYSFPGNFQIQASLLDNIGRVNFGGKYGVTENLSIGGGVAYNLAHFGSGKHGIMARDNAKARLGAYLTYGMVKLPTFEAAITPHTQIGDRVSMGVDFGLMGTASEWVSFIMEVGTSFDFHDDIFYFNTDGGVRIHPPTIPFLSFDLGIDIEEFPVGYDAPSVGPYIDVIFAIKTPH